MLELLRSEVTALLSYVGLPVFTLLLLRLDDVLDGRLLTLPPRPVELDVLPESYTGRVLLLPTEFLCPFDGLVVILPLLRPVPDDDLETLEFRPFELRPSVVYRPFPELDLPFDV